MARLVPNLYSAALYAVLILASTVTAQQLQPIPIGIDAYRQWDHWPEQRIGMRAYMRSTYDRSGGNEGADSGHFLYQLRDDFNISLDLEGPGILVFSRFNHWHGSPWHFVVDGTDHVVAETSTADPLHPSASPQILPAAAFPLLLNPTWVATKGSDLIWTPIPFERSFQMAYGRTHYGTGYYIYDKFVPGIPLSHPMQSWDEQTADANDVLALLARAGSDIAPTTGVAERRGVVEIPAGGTVEVVRLKKKAEIRALQFSISRAEAPAFEHVRLRITWDGRKQPSIDAPVSLFYGAGTLFNRDNREYLVKAFPVSIHFTPDRVELACYFPMPFFRSARIELAGAGASVSGVQWRLRTMPEQEPANHLAYFHATYRDIPYPVPGEDMTWLDTRGIEGARDWSGSFVGTSFIFSHEGRLSTLEGDPRFFFDDSLTPQAQGTGTEEWGGGGDYWARGAYASLPLTGHPVGAPMPCTTPSPERSDCKPGVASLAMNDEDKIESAYRFLLGDLMPFGKNAVIRMEHGGTDQADEHYEAVTYWYGLPSPSLVETDHLQIGNLADERAHGYQSPQASAPYTISSRYEWGVDTFDGKQVFPETQDTGRTTTGTSQFRLRVRADNVGVMIRRKLDYTFPDQRAEVYIADDPNSQGQLAGIWYLAGSNRCVYSHPRSELGEPGHEIETSNRRFRDDELLVPRDLTRGRKAIWVRIKFTQLNRPLTPGGPVPQQAWSEIHYAAYSFVFPKFRR